MIGLLLCRLGIHSWMEPGNCILCGYRYHGNHVGSYREWQAQRRIRRLAKEARQ